MFVRRTLKELGELAVNEIGFCVGIHWRSVRGSRVPEGMISPSYRLAAVLFTGYGPAYRFHALLTRRGVERLPRRRVRLVQVSHEGQRAIGVAVTAVVSPDSRHAIGFRRAPACAQQPGYRRYFQRLALASMPRRPWWEGELGGTFEEGRFEAHGLDHIPGYAERQADEELERELDRLEAEYDEKLWWYGEPGRRTKYPPALGSVQELFAYARRQELPPEEVARRNRERQAERWLSDQHERDRRRQQQLDADQSEVAAALHTPRPGRKHADDEAWLTTETVIRGRKALKRLYRDAALAPQRPREA